MTILEFFRATRFAGLAQDIRRATTIINGECQSFTTLSSVNPHIIEKNPKFLLNKKS